jgi:hypothetical protein
MAAFEYRQAQELRDVFTRWGVHYLFLGKSGAIVLGFPDTTQDVDVFPQRSVENGRALVEALRELGFALTEGQADEIVRGKDFVQLKNVPFFPSSSLARSAVRSPKNRYSGGRCAAAA